MKAGDLIKTTCFGPSGFGTGNASFNTSCIISLNIDLVNFTLNLLERCH